jgi:hypothetical protein
MSKRNTILYFSFAPILFLLSYYISHRVYVKYMLNGSLTNEGNNRPWIYSGFLVLIYIAAYFVMKDIYRKKS